jgi:ATP-dependent helicase/DNAse subunit B
MALRFICGPTGSGKTARAIEVFLAALDRGESAVFIAPSRPDARHFQRRILDKRPILTGGKITTFGDLCDEIVKKDGFQSRVVSDVERRVLIEAVIHEAKVSFLEASSKYKGFIEAFDSLVAEMEGAGIGPGMLATAGKGIIAPELNSDLFSLYSGYRELLDEQKITDIDLARRTAVERLGEDPSLLQYQVAVIDGFWDYTSLERVFLGAWENSTIAVLATIPFTEGKISTEAPGLHLSDLMQRSECEFLAAPVADERPAVLVQLDRYLFEEIPDSEKVPADDTVVVLEGAGNRGQAEMVASEILAIWRARESGLDDIAVVFRNLGSGARAVAAALDDFDIPYDLPAEESLKETPLGQVVVSLLDFVARDLAGEKGSSGNPVNDAGSRDTLLRYLRSSYPITSNRKVDEFARAAVMGGIDDTARLIGLWKDLGGRDLWEISRLEKAARSGLAGLGKEISNLAQNLVSRRILAGEDSLGLNDPESCEVDMMALKMIAGICDQASCIESLNYAGIEAVMLVRDGIQAGSLRSPSAGSRGCVRLLDPHRALNQRFKVVFLCGLLEREFPSLGREEPFLSDSVREKLKEKGLDLNCNQGRLEDERFLFHRALTRAREKVYLCYPYCSNEGKEHVPSLFVDESLELFEELNGAKRWRRVISDVTFSPGKAPQEKQALRSLCLIAGERRSADGALAPAAVKDLLSAAKRGGIDGSLKECLEATKTKGPVFRDAGVRSKFENLKVFSASQLENYARCPFAYYVDRILEPALMEMDSYALDRGSIAHAVLCEFSKAIKSHVVLGKADKGQLAAARGKMQEILKQELKERVLGSDADSALLRYTLQYHLDRFIDRETSYQSLLVPDGFELPFGDSADVAALQLGEGLALRGVIDRVDRIQGGDLALAIDYKTSARIPKRKDFEEEQKVQVPLYMLALRQYGLVPVGGEYYSIMGEERRGIYLDGHDELFGTRDIKKNDKLSEAEFNRELDDALARALKLAKGIRAMSFSQHSLNDRVCNYCNFGAVCRGGN